MKFKNILIKGLIFVFLFAGLTTITGCDLSDLIANNSNEPNESTEEQVIKLLNEAYLQLQEGDTLESITKDITFKQTIKTGFAYDWKSSNTDVISNSGKVTRPANDVNVKITLDITCGDVKLTKSFDIIVKGTSNTQEVNPSDNPDTPENPNTPITPVEGETSIATILALTIADGETTTEKYTTTAIITEVKSTEYGNCVISDGSKSIDVYGLYGSNGEKYNTLEYKPVVGDTITINGAIKNYMNAFEFFNATLVKVVKGNGGNTDTPDTPVTPVEGETSIATILALKISDGATTTEKYTSTGTITEVQNTTYGNVIISDGTSSILVYGIYDATGARYDALSYKPVVGDTITVNGAIKNYTGTIEFVNATLVKVVKGTGGNQGDDIGGGNTEAKVIDSTIAEVLGLAIENGKTTTDLYKVTGKILSFDNTEYGNCYITDGTKTLYVYGINNADGKKYNELTSKPEAGDEITVYGAVKNYNGTIEIINSILVSFEKGVAVTVEQKTIAEVKALPAGSIAKTSGTVIATYAKGYMVQDSTGAILVYMNAKSYNFVVGDTVLLEGGLTAYHNSVQFTETVTATKSGSVTYTNPTPTVVDELNIDDFVGNPIMGEYIEVTGKLIIDGTYYNVEIANSTKAIAIQYPAASFNLAKMGNKQIKLAGYVMDVNSEVTRLNVMLVAVECLEEIVEGSLPIESNFITAQSSKTLADGWTWETTCSKGAYATGWQSFRDNGNGIKSSDFAAQNSVKVSFTCYLNNTGTGSSYIKVIAYDSEGKEVTSQTSEDINKWTVYKQDKTTKEILNSKTLEFTLSGENICYIKIEFVKESGGNIGFSTVKIEAVEQ